MQEQPMIGHITKQWADHAQIKTWYAEETTSTNEKAKQLLATPEYGQQPIALFLTDFQTEGKGRGKHLWITDQDGQALLSSWCFHLPTPPQPILSPLVGLAVLKALHNSWPFLQWSLKAPNDIYIGNKKVAGILIENIQQGASNNFIVGFGLNVLDAPEELDNATSIAREMPKGAPLLGEDYVAFLERLLNEFTLILSENPTELSPNECLSLAWALNRFTDGKERVQMVTPHGNLVYSDKTIKWTDL